MQATKRARPESPLSWPLLSSRLLRHIILIVIVFMWQVFRWGAAMAVVLGATYPDLFMAIGAVAGLEFAAAPTAVASLAAITMGGPGPNRQGLLAFQAMSVGLRQRPKRRMPVIVFQGAADPYLNPVNADQVLAQWARTKDYLDGNGKSLLDQAGEPTNGSVPGGYSFQKCEYEDSAGRLLMEKAHPRYGPRMARFSGGWTLRRPERAERQ